MSITLLSATVELFNKRLQEMEAKVETVEAQKGDKGDRGETGKAGKDGKDGRDGAAGLTGPAGKDGNDGVDGTDGVSVVDAVVDIDGHLVLTLSNGNEIDAGDLTEAWKDSDKVIQILRGGGPNTQQIKEDIKVLQERADETDTEQAEQDTRLDNVESKNTEQDTRLDTNESDINSLETRADANDTKNTEQDTRLSSLETTSADQETRIQELEDMAAQTTGTWGYDAGVSGTATLPANARILQISATTLTGGNFTVNGGSAVTLPANQQFTLEPKGNLVSPTLVFNNTTSYVVEYVV